jgi:Ca-activated chloride channel family protein
MPTTTLITTTKHNSSGGRMTTADGRSLPLQSARLAVSAGGGLARSVLLQCFTNVHTETLNVSYQLPLPADGAVSAFRFRFGDREIVGQIAKKADAREHFEEALLSGHSAALVEQDRSSLFTQELANLPAGQTIECEITVDHPLAWMTDGSWEYRFPTTVATRYQGAEGRVPDAERVQVTVSQEDTGARLTLDMQIEDSLTDETALTSPSHTLAIRTEVGATRACLSCEQGAALDRDVVLQWRVSTPEVGAQLRHGMGGGQLASRAFGLLTLVPPCNEESTRASQGLARELVLLIDTSGSMGGQPLAQATQVLRHMIESLADGDLLEMIEFSMQPRRWSEAPVRIDATTRSEALQWLDALRAGGGTEMRDAILESLRPLSFESQRQVVLVTDGYIGFEQEIIGTIAKKLPPSSRVHTIGVGSSVNRSLTSGAARAGRGVEVIIGLDEEVPAAVRRIVARTAAPIVVDLCLAGSALRGSAPRFLPDLFAQEPAKISVELAPEGGQLELRGRTRTGAWVETIQIDALDSQKVSEELASLYGREQVEDLETDIAAGEARHAIDMSIESLGLAYRISTRLTSWIAVSDELSVDPREPSRREIMPQALPYGLSVEGLGLRPSLSSGMESAAGGMSMLAACMPVPQSSKRFIGGVMTDMLGRLGSSAAGPGSESDSDFGFEDDDESMMDGGESLDSTEAEAFEIEEELVPAGMTLVAHVRSSSKWGLLFEIESPGFAWRLPKKVTLIMDDGRQIILSVKSLRSTRSCQVPSGRQVRLCIEAPTQPSNAKPVELRWTESDSITRVEIR